MAIKFMDQDLFEYFSTTIAKLALLENRSPGELFDTIWESYKDAIIDDDVKLDVLVAVENSKNKLKEWEVAEPVEFLSQFLFYIENFDRAGNKKRKKIFRGLRFMKSVQNPNRIGDFLKRMTSFHFMIKSGLISISRTE